jgi:hypothetical protein
MKYSIDLQSPFSFSPYWYAVGVALIVFALFGTLFFLQWRMQKRLT